MLDFLGGGDGLPSGNVGFYNVRLWGLSEVLFPALHERGM